MAGLTAKVFRTYNASFTMSTLLKNLNNREDMPVAEKIKLYNECNRKVAILCNHKRTVGASHEAAMEKMGDKVRASREVIYVFRLTLHRSKVSSTRNGALSR